LYLVFWCLHTILTVLINDTFLCSRVCCWGSATGGADSDVAASEPGTPAEDKESGQAFGGGEFLIVSVPDSVLFRTCLRSLYIPSVACDSFERFFVKAGMNILPLEVSLLSNFSFVFSVLLTCLSLEHVRLL
jgi:hypothetical protein